ncbi:MAG: hypothetical protein Q7K57_52325 [Burkholderiaceae bacterium]|nr:hypothetical protein [Burkholderiaceae bacterium]
MTITTLEQDACRALAKMIRQFLFGFTLAEIEADLDKNQVERDEVRAKQVHKMALERLEKLAMGLEIEGTPVRKTETMLERFKRIGDNLEKDKPAAVTALPSLKQILRI